MSAIKRIFLRSLIIAVALATITTFFGRALLSRSLPLLDGTVSVAGVDGAVTIERDAQGVPTITAANREDLAFATGFTHAQDRFFQMDLYRRQSAGELSELFGTLALERDKRSRIHRFRSRASENLAGLDSRDAAVLSAYADGVNEGLATLDAKPFEYYLLGVDPTPWKAEDSLLVVYTMFMRLNYERASRDVARGLAYKALPESVFFWLYPEGTEWDAPLMGRARKSGDIPPVQTFDLSGIEVAMSIPLADEPEFGSNNWAVSGTLTDSGRALVANDMHLGISVPTIWYRARLRIAGSQPLDLNGVTLPGTPIVPAGSNTYIAWGNTNSNGDWADAVVIVPGDAPGSYMTPDGEQSFVEFRETIHVKGEDAEELLIRETEWGPIDDSNPDPERMLAISWIAHHREALSIRHLALERATSVDEALHIANTIGMPPQNFVVGDAQGNIGWTIAGSIPRRSDEDSTLPVNWSDGGEWSGWLSPDEYPRIVNPESGRIWTANARVADGRTLHVIGTDGYAFGARAQQIRDGLQNRSSFTAQDMLDIQLDSRAIFLGRWREKILEVLRNDVTAGNKDREEYRALVENWIPKAVADSVGYRFVRAFRVEVRDRVFSMFMQPVRERFGADVELMASKQFEAPLWSMLSEKPAHLLTANYDSWDDLMLQAIDANIAYFKSEFDGELAERTWGERNTARIDHPLSGSIPLFGKYLNMRKEPLDGDTDLPRVQRPDNGASERFGVAPGDEANAYMQLPVGQSGHPLSEFYDSTHDDWVNGRFAPFLPGDSQHTLTLEPAK